MSKLKVLFQPIITDQEFAKLIVAIFAPVLHPPLSSNVSINCGSPSAILERQKPPK